ncbi:transcription factor A, mitochondrial-like [Bradysia coprophila]|uniref:transcription factor A, mitochondrial-like n=1 Tax=Bradysia coprophila TaxID=38358 RepID=UPI00187DA342|nr:transcription factor A, mitochondrial-like [Bradysia coprophila]
MISQFLSNAVRTVRVLATHNAPITSTLSVISTITRRTVYSNPFQNQIRLPPDVRKSVEKIMGPRPKQPLSPYFRFMLQIRPQVIAENPHLKRNKLHTIFSEKWKSLDADQKAIFSAEYRNGMSKYLKEIWEYNRKMSENDFKQMQKELQDTADKKQIKLYREEARKLNKPKRPVTAFLKFFQSQTDRPPGRTYREHMQQMSLKWRSLSENERSKYKTKPDELDKYKKAMRTWEGEIGKMITDKDGNENVR